MTEFPSKGMTADDVPPAVRADLKTRGGTVYEFSSMLDMGLERNVACVQVRTEDGEIVLPWTPIEFVGRPA